MKFTIEMHTMIVCIFYFINRKVREGLLHKVLFFSLPSKHGYINILCRMRFQVAKQSIQST